MENQEIIDSVSNTLKIESEEVGQLFDRLSKESIIETVKKIGECSGKIVLSGCGTSGMAAKKITHTLRCVEIPAIYLNPTDAVHGALGVLQKNDILILISKGGNTDQLLSLIPACKKKGAYLIGVGEDESSTIAKEANLFLKIKVDREPDEWNMLATASTMAVISYFDAIAIALMSYNNYTKEQFATIHPSGAVGEQLVKKVE